GFRHGRWNPAGFLRFDTRGLPLQTVTLLRCGDHNRCRSQLEGRAQEIACLRTAIALRRPNSKTSLGTLRTNATSKLRNNTRQTRSDSPARERAQSFEPAGKPHLAVRVPAKTDLAAPRHDSRRQLDRNPRTTSSANPADRPTGFAPD